MSSSLRAVARECQRVFAASSGASTASGGGGGAGVALGAAASGFLKDDGLAAALSELQPSTLGFELPPCSLTADDGVQYLHLFSTEHFSCGVFQIPAGGVIPCHDHPEMCVYSRPLYGSVRVRSYDWAEDVGGGGDGDASHGGGLRAGVARLVSDRVVCAEDGVLFLGPREGNVHAFEATSEDARGCALLDVLSPDCECPACL